MNMSVVQYDSDYVPNPSPTGETAFEEFWQVRASVLAASQEHGETGPESKSDNAIYWIVDDQYNDERYQNMEVYKPEGSSRPGDIRFLHGCIASPRRRSSSSTLPKRG